LFVSKAAEPESGSSLRRGRTRASGIVGGHVHRRAQTSVGRTPGHRQLLSYAGVIFEA